MPTAKTFILLLSVLFSTMIYCCGSPTTLVLERIDSVDIEHSEVIARDRLRHDRVFQRSSLHGVVEFPLQGSADPTIFGRYFTRVKLGNPPREYSVMIDTGSDVTWVNCVSCTGCPRTSQVIQLSFYDPQSSSSAAPVSCSDKICKSAQTHGCSSSSLCSYSLPYGDGTSVSGYYVSDTFHFDTLLGNSVTAISSPNIVFGCSNNESGQITRLERAIDGLLGLGHHPISVTAQLAARKITPNIFSHCLKGDQGGGGILVLGEIVEPGIVYTPLVLSEPHYNVNLLSIFIGGRIVPIHPKIFATSRNQGTVVDSGSTFAYLADEVYDPFVTTLLAAVPPSVNSFTFDGQHCFHISNSTRDVFPLVSLHFEGGAAMILKLDEYLLKRFDFGPEVWCLGFQKNQLRISHGLTILGEQVLKDKIIVYDLARQRLGWADYDCSSSVNVSLVPPRISSSSRDAVFILVLLHASCPFSREASYLAFVYPQVYLDFGLAVPSVHGMISSIKELLELAPTKKIIYVMFSTHGYAFAETFYLGAKRVCQVLSSVLCGACNNGDLSVLEAVEAAEDILKKCDFALQDIVFVRIIWVDTSGQHRFRLVEG